jgi:hypothetical protein
VADLDNTAPETGRSTIAAALHQAAEVIQRVAPEIAERAKEAADGAGLGTADGLGMGAFAERAREVIEAAQPMPDAAALREAANDIVESELGTGPGNAFEGIRELLPEIQERVQAVMDDQAVIEAEAPQVLEASATGGSDVVPATTDEVSDDAADDATDI